MEQVSRQEQFLAGVAREVSLHMTDSWTVSQVKETSFHLTGPDGMEIYFWSGGIWYDSETGELNTDDIKFQVKGVFPEGTFVLRNEEPKEIYVSYKRGAKAIARDVQRRYIEKYAPIYYVKLKEQGEHRAYANDLRRALESLATAFGGEVGLDRDSRPDHVVIGKRYNSDRPCGKVNASNSLLPGTREREGWYVHLDLRRIPIALALEIGNLFADPQLRLF